MSRLIKKPIQLSSQTTVTIENNTLVVKGPKGETRVTILPGVEVAITEGNMNVTMKGSNKQTKANAGTLWSLARNAVAGVNQEFVRVLEIHGVGYRAVLDGKTLVLSLGYVNPVRFESPEGITIVVEKNQIKISGIDKELVGRVAGQLRTLKKPEPYKGKGIRYQGEVIRIKAGKKAATGSK